MFCCRRAVDERWMIVADVGASEPITIIGNIGDTATAALLRAARH